MRELTTGTVNRSPVALAASKELERMAKMKALAEVERLKKQLDGQ
jgi:hypothetical protein